MPRNASPNNKIFHTHYRRAWLFIRGDVFYTSIDSVQVKSTKIEAIPKNRAMAVRVLNQRVEEYLRLNELSNASITVKDAAMQFAQSKKKRIAVRTLEQYATVFNTYLTADMLVSDTLNIRRHVLSIVNTSTHKQNTINFHLRALHTFFAYCIEMEYCDKNPITAAMIPDKITNEPRPFTRSEITEIIEQLRTGANYRKFTKEREEMVLLIRLLSVAGLRIAEALRLNKADILPDGLRIDGKRVSINKPKIRFIPFRFLPELAEICETLKTYNSGERVFTWVNRANPSEKLRNTMISLGMDVTNKNLHSLRKTALNWWEKELGLPEEIRNMLAGHTSAVKSNYYRPNDMADTINKIESLSKFVGNVQGI